MATLVSSTPVPAHLFRARCFGDFALIDAVSGISVGPRGRKASALLAYLIFHPDRPTGREKLAALLWGNRPDEQARSSLRQTLFELRPFSAGDTPLLTVARSSVALNSALIKTDIALLHELRLSQDFQTLANSMPQSSDELFSNLDDVGEEFDDWLRVERTRQRDTIAAIIADASDDAARAGQVRVARDLRLRLQNFLPDSTASPDLVTVSPIPLIPLAPARSWSRRSILVGASLSAVGVLGVLATRGAAFLSPAPRSEEARSLYATALPLVRRRGAEMATAVELLNRAVILDPEFARGWAALAAATAMVEYSPKNLAVAESAARRALAIDPDLAEAHGALGMILGFSSDEAGAHLKRAVALAPNDAQNLFWLSNHYGSRLQFSERLGVLRRAVAIDPSWPRAASSAALAAWELGHHEEARSIARAVERIDPASALKCDYEVDFSDGKFAALAQKLFSIRRQAGITSAVDRNLGAVLLILGDTALPKLLLRLSPEQWEIATAGSPSQKAVRNAEAATALDVFEAQAFLAVAMQKALACGRASWLASIYDARGPGDLGLIASRAANPRGIARFGADMALALRECGRQREATALLGQAQRHFEAAYARGPVPDWFEIAAAKLWSLRGDPDRAIAALRRAHDRGWHYAPIVPLPDLTDVQAFRVLESHADFKAVRAAQRAHLELERAKLGAVLSA